MDSLIVLRKPLRKRQLVQTFLVPNKSKKALPKVDPIPPDVDLSVDSNKCPISFVKLYEDLCLENRRRDKARVRVREPPRARGNTPATHSLQTPCEESHSLQMHSDASHSLQARSDASLRTQYCGRYGVACSSRLYHDSLPPGKARVKLLLELDYDTNSISSGFC